VPMTVTRILLLPALLVMTGLFVRPAVADDTGEWKSLFDGKTLNGWHHFGTGKWLVEDGAIVGRTQEGADLFSLLISDAVYHDFTVRFKFKSLQGNSGFYVRMVPEDPDRANGLQIEVDPRNESGGIYESYRRKWVDKPTKEEQQQYFKPKEWNSVEISAYGGDVTVKTNGIVSAELKNDPSRPAGHLAMQMHAHNKLLVMFKDIEIKAVPRSGPDKKAPTEPKQIAQDAEGVMTLSARHAKIVGKSPSLAYMPEWQALGFWQSPDHAEWDVDVSKAGTYEVLMEWSVDDQNGGKPFVLEAGKQRIEGKVPSTGNWERFKIQKIGEVTLEPGTYKFAMKPNGEFKGALMDLRELRIQPPQPPTPAPVKKPAADAKK
jgi:hypothetical protein